MNEQELSLDLDKVQPIWLCRLGYDDIFVMRGLPFITMRCLTSSSDYAMKNTKLWRTSSYINGKWTDGCTDLGTFDVFNPATGGVVAKCSRANRKDVTEAAEAAHVAWKSWRATLAADRASYLRRLSELMKQNIDDLAFIITMESGKPIAEAKGEINYAKSFLDFYAEEATRTRGDIMENAANGQKMMTLIQSVGPAALITPWNFPAASKNYLHRIMNTICNRRIQYCLQ